jgi:hypothetical protein
VSPLAKVERNEVRQQLDVLHIDVVVLNLFASSKRKPSAPQEGGARGRRWQFARLATPCPTEHLRKRRFAFQSVSGGRRTVLTLRLIGEGFRDE